MIELKPVTLDKEYAKKWNEHCTDFVHLYRDGAKVSDQLYRRGGLGGEFKDGYILLLKYTEDLYNDSITKDKARKHHLKGCWCILDEKGVEKVINKPFEYLNHNGGQIYSIENDYYNIETKELYCKAYGSMKTKDFIFINNAYDKDKSKRGVMKINKWDGTFELFQE